jgi:hypothetical protein
MGRIKRKYFYRYVVIRGGRSIYKTNILSNAQGEADLCRGIVIDVLTKAVVYYSKGTEGGDNYAKTKKYL